MGIAGIRSEQLLPVGDARGDRAGDPSLAASRAPPPSAPFERALASASQAVDRGEALIANAAELRDYDTPTLIALQAGIYRYSEAVELLAKIVDHTTAAARTVLQGGNH